MIRRNFNMLIYISIITSFFVLFFSGIADAKYLYVDIATGNDAVTYNDNSANRPWSTIGRAAWGSTSRSSPNSSQAAKAGDTVIVRSGTYNAAASSGQRYEPAYNPINSGLAGNPITFKSEGIVYLRSTNASGPVIGALNKNYIIWDGFIIDEQFVNTIPDTGPVVLWSANNCEIRNCNIKGFARWTDNHNAIRLEYTNNCIVRNNILWNVWDAAGINLNAAAIMTYATKDVLIEHNEIYNCETGIYLKGPSGGANINERATVRYNLIRNTGVQGIEAHRQYVAYIYQNVIRDAYQGRSASGIRVINFPNDPYGPSPANIRIVNNVIKGMYTALSIAVSSSGTGHLIYNNIIANVNDVYDALSTETARFSNKSVIDVEHNIYYSFRSIGNIGGNWYAFSSYKSTTGQDAAFPSSSNVDPLFVNLELNDFHLRTGSPASNAGIDVLDLNGNGNTTDRISAGAYITGTEVIGPTTGVFPRPQAGSFLLLLD